MAVTIFKTVLISLGRRALYKDLKKNSNSKAKIFGIYLYLIILIYSLAL